MKRDPVLWRRTIAVGLFLLAALFPDVDRASAQGDPGVVTLPDLIREALENNPEIQAARARWEAAQRRIQPAGALPDPFLAFRLQNIGSGRLTVGEEEMSTAGVTISQEVPFPGKRPLMEKMARGEADREEAEVRAVEWRVIGDLKRTWFNFYLSEKSIEILRQAKILLETLTETARSRYAVGKGIQQDVLRAQVEHSRFLEQVILLEQERATDQARINRLLNRPIGAPLGHPGEPVPPGTVPPLEELESLLLEKSPLLQEAKKTIGVREAALDLARKQYYPDLEFSGGYFSRGDLPEMVEAMVGLRIPLYSARKQGPRVEAARSDLSSAEKAHEETRLALLYRLRELTLEARAAKEQSDLLEQGILPQAMLSMESARSGYEVGTVDFLTLLDNLVTLLKDRLEYHEAHVRYVKAMAGLEEAIGADLKEPGSQ
ncbi:MAG: TolC family protein [Nitrospirae bacterium]|nr:TolC family protein [Nitrospirota bacterium]